MPKLFPVRVNGQASYSHAIKIGTSDPDQVPCDTRPQRVFKDVATFVNVAMEVTVRNLLGKDQ